MHKGVAEKKSLTAIPARPISKSDINTFWFWLYPHVQNTTKECIMGDETKLSDRKARILQEVSGAERLADILSNHFGYQIKKKGGRFWFALRKDEKTPSCCVNNNGSVHDFGSGETFSFLSLVANEFNIHEADTGKQFLAEIKKAEEILGIQGDTCTYAFTSPKLSEEQLAKGEYITEPLDEGYIGYFKAKAIENKSRVIDLMRHMMLTATDTERSATLTRFEVGYDPKRDRLIFPVRDLDGICRNMFRYTPFPSVSEEGDKSSKVLYLSKRKRGLFNMKALKSKPRTLYILEGEKDVVNATAFGVAAVTQGSAGSWKPEMADQLYEACMEIGFIPENIYVLQDHDMPGLISSLNIYSDLKSLFPSVKMIFWHKETASWLKKQLTNSESIKKLTENAKISTDWMFKKLVSLLSESSIDAENICVMKNAPSKDLLVKGFDYSDYKSMQYAS